MTTNNNHEEEALFSIWRSYGVVMAMLRDRGYDVSKYVPMEQEKFIEWAGSTVVDARKEISPLVINGAGKKPIAVFWRETLGSQDMKQIAEQMDNVGTKNAIAIYSNKITPHATSAIRCLRMNKIVVETFSEQEVQVNITEHEYVPKHRICTPAEKEVIMKGYCITRKEQLQQIRTTDSVARYYGMVPGMLIEIDRPSETMPEINIDGKKVTLMDLSYRIVV
jgi:DNA-directed RNA polymerase I, II, and III subunit RPABC1